MAAETIVESWTTLILRTQNEQIRQNGYQNGQKGYKNGVNEHKRVFLPPGEGQKVSKTNSDQKHGLRHAVQRDGR